MTNIENLVRERWIADLRKEFDPAVILSPGEEPQEGELARVEWDLRKQIAGTWDIENSWTGGDRNGCVERTPAGRQLLKQQQKAEAVKKYYLYFL